MNFTLFFGELRIVVFGCPKGTFSRVPVVSLSITKAIHLQNVVRRAHQCPLAAYLFKSTQEKLSESPRPFDLSKDRFHNALPRCIYGRSRLRLELAPHFIHPRDTLREWPAFAGLRLISVFLSACRYINVHRFLLQMLKIPFARSG